MKRTEIVHAGAARLVQTEAAIETAICETADLISYLGRTRMEQKIALEVGEEAMKNLVITLTSLSEARASVLLAHDNLNTVKRQLGCATVALGTGENKSPPKPKGLLVVPETDQAA